MIETAKSFPRVLLQKLLLTALIGIGCIIIGVVYFIFSGDNVFLGLSSIVFISCLIRFCGLYRLITKKRYQSTEGICVAITPKPLRRYRKVKFLDTQGTETTLLLDNRTKLCIGFSYRCYFKVGTQPALGSEYLDTALSSDGFLGIEELGEYIEPSTEKQ